MPFNCYLSFDFPHVQPAFFSSCTCKPDYILLSHNLFEAWRPVLIILNFLMPDRVVLCEMGLHLDQQMWLATTLQEVYRLWLTFIHSRDVQGWIMLCYVHLTFLFVADFLELSRRQFVTMNMLLLCYAVGTALICYYLTKSYLNFYVWWPGALHFFSYAYFLQCVWLLAW